MFRFFPAILLIQIITAALIFALIKGEFDNQLLIILAVFWLIISILTSFWFSSMANHVHKDVLAKTVDEHTREREKIRVNAERQKTKALKNSHQEILKESRRVNRKANMKVGSILVLIRSSRWRDAFYSIYYGRFVDPGNCGWRTCRLSWATASGEKNQS